MKAPIKKNSEVRFIANRHSDFTKEDWRAIAPEHLKFKQMVDPDNLLKIPNEQTIPKKDKEIA